MDEGKEQRLFVRILREIEANHATDYGARLVVLYYSGETCRGDLGGWREMMVPLLRASGVPALDVNALLNRTMASALVEDFARGAIKRRGLQCTR